MTANSKCRFHDSHLASKGSIPFHLSHRPDRVCDTRDPHSVPFSTSVHEGVQRGRIACCAPQTRSTFDDDETFLGVPPTSQEPLSGLKQQPKVQPFRSPRLFQRSRAWRCDCLLPSFLPPMTELGVLFNITMYQVAVARHSWDTSRSDSPQGGQENVAVAHCS